MNTAILSNRVALPQRFIALVGLLCGVCFGNAVLAQQSSTEEGLRLAPSGDLGSRGNTDYVSTGAAPISIRSAPLPSSQSIRIDAGQRVEVAPGAKPDDPAGAGESGERLSPQALARRAANTRSRSEFQQLIYQTRGRDLEHFGRNLFGAAPSTYALTDRIVPPMDYVVAPGDEVRIRAWGQVDIDFVGSVERNGALYIPVIGAVPVAGVTFRDLAPLVRSRIARSYKSFELDVSLGQIRMMQIFVTGQASKPGSYTIGGMSSLINAVFAVGGPSETGSMRAIELRRSGKLVTKLDLYSFLLNGDKSQDVRLQSGDVIQFPPIQGQAAIAGSVKSPGIFEVLQSTSMGELLALAGGLSTTAGGGSVIVERIEERRARQVAEFPLDGSESTRPIRDGDVVQINPISPRFENSITIRGYVPETQRLAFRPGMRVTDVLPSQLALLANNYWLRKNEKGRGSHWLLEPQYASTGPDNGGAAGSQDRMLARGVDAGRAPRSDRSDGLVRPELDSRQPLAALRAYRNDDGDLSARPLSSRREDAGQAELLDDLARSSVEVNWDYALIERLDPKTLRTNLLPFHLGRAVIERDANDNLLLAPGDIITVFSTRDIRVPVERQPQYIKLEGEVSRPGVYQIAYGETLANLIKRTGGLTANAYLYGGEFTREDTREFQQRELDASVERLSQSLERSATTRLRESLDGGSSGTPDSAAGMLDAQRRLVRRLKQVRATGRVVLDVVPDQASLEHLDIPLEDGDRYYVPARPSTVIVVGAVNRPNALLYRERRTLDEYLLQAGGVTRDAAAGDTFIIRPNGSVLPIKTSAWFGRPGVEALLPGDAIVVPEDTDSVTWRRVLRDWTQIVYQGALGVAGIRLLNDVLKR